MGVSGDEAQSTGFSANEQKMGSNVTLTDEELVFLIGWEAPAIRVGFIHMGVEIEPATRRLDRAALVLFEHRQVQKPGWISFDLVSTDDETLLIGNPVYLTR